MSLFFFVRLRFESSIKDDLILRYFIKVAHWYILNTQYYLFYLIISWMTSRSNAKTTNRTMKFISLIWHLLSRQFFVLWANESNRSQEQIFVFDASSICQVWVSTTSRIILHRANVSIAWLVMILVVRFSYLFEEQCFVCCRKRLRLKSRRLKIKLALLLLRRFIDDMSLTSRFKSVSKLDFLEMIVWRVLTLWLIFIVRRSRRRRCSDKKRACSWILRKKRIRYRKMRNS
jgi:hypothetical protein